MVKQQHNTGLQAAAFQDLLFELSETRQAKFCIAVCDNLAQRKKLTEAFHKELEEKGIETLTIKLTPATRDLVEILRERLDVKKQQVAIVDGFEDMAEDAVNLTLSYLNFKRDIILSIQIPILFWFSNRILSKVVARAPDFWSRRTVTQYFTVERVTSLLEKLFAEETKQSPSVQKDGKVFKFLQKVFSYERELEQLTQHSKQISSLEIDRLISGIQLGINDLITECHVSNRFEVTFRLWILAGIDKWLSRIRRHAKARFEVSVGSLYAERTDILLKVADKMPRILENYQSNLASRVSEGRKVNLLGYFTACVEDESQRMFNFLVKDQRMISRMSPEDIQDLAIEDERLQVSLSDKIRQRAAEELSQWIESKQKSLPKFLSVEEGKVLRLLYRGKREPSVVADALGITEEDAKEKITKIRSKVLLFLGMEPGS